MRNTLKALAVLAIFTGGTSAISAPAVNTVKITAPKGTYLVHQGQCSAKKVAGAKAVACTLGSQNIIVLKKGNETCALSMKGNNIDAKGCKSVNSIKNNNVVLK